MCIRDRVYADGEVFLGIAVTDNVNPAYQGQRNFPVEVTVMVEGPQSVFANLNSLTAMEIPASIELIEDGAFADCHSLTVITFEKNSNLKAIGNSAFDSD